MDSLRLFPARRPGLRWSPVWRYRTVRAGRAQPTSHDAGKEWRCAHTSCLDDVHAQHPRHRINRPGAEAAHYTSCPSVRKANRRRWPASSVVAGRPGAGTCHTRSAIINFRRNAYQRLISPLASSAASAKLVQTRRPMFRTPMLRKLLIVPVTAVISGAAGRCGS